MFGKVLSMPLVLNIPEFWIAKDSKYVSGSQCVRVLDIQGFSGFECARIYQSFKYARVTQGSEFAWIISEYAWICLIMSGYVWICLNMLEYAWICLNLPEWLLFYISPFSHLFYNPFSTWTCRYLFERLQETRRYSLEEHEAVSLKKQNLIFL